MYKKAFWALIFVTTLSVAFLMGGYEILDTVIFLILMDFVALWLYLEKRKDMSSIDNGMIKKIESLELACSNILENVSSVPLILNLEEKINKQREDIESMLDKINEKTLNLEDKLNNFGQSLSNKVVNFNDKSIEDEKYPSDKE